MAPKPKNLVRNLSRRGPHRVLRGDLAFAGLPGVVCTPESGLGLPAVAFGHGWLNGPQHYLETLAHLASWGIVAAAPATQRGLLPSARELAADLTATLDICASVRLGRDGNISVHPSRLALAGHGFGAGAAVLAASERTAAGGTLAAVAALFPAPVDPPAEGIAPGITAPALIVAAPGTDTLAAADAVALAQSWGGEARTRVLPAATEEGLVEGRRWAGFLGLPASERKTQLAVRALLTGYLLHQLTGDKAYAVFADAETELAGSLPVAQESLAEPLEQKPTGLVRTVLSLR
ncbi:poly(ethylene terephthalate) hydrolase family protein [Tomitella biformata]|uniref:poly(ethylene terephthalate) hydrolase family protein n=1 Tax=Tomitella biformata TaxID=630403 RepID=UPI000463309C|nr:hypothetical protein [Tomitella biformata]